MQAFTGKLANAPIYIEHVAVPNAIGKVTKTDWDGHNLWYEAEIYDEPTAEKIRKGIVQHVSIGADYEAVDLVDGKIPHGLHNAELSLVALPGIPETNINVLESLLHGSERKVVNEKALEKLVSEAVQKGNTELKVAHEKLTETEGKLFASEKALAEAIGKLAEVQKTIEQLKTGQQTALVKDQPKTIPISEAVAILERLLPVPTVEHSTLGMQRECQAIRAAIHNLQGRLA